MAEPVVWHLHFELPGTGLVGDAHQDLPLLDRPQQEPVANLTGDDHAVDRALDLEILPAGLPKLKLLFEALDFSLELRRPARKPDLLIRRDLLIFQE